MKTQEQLDDEALELADRLRSFFECEVDANVITADGIKVTVTYDSWVVDGCGYSDLNTLCNAIFEEILA